MPSLLRQTPPAAALYGVAAQGLWTLLLVGVCGCVVPGIGRASQSTAAPEQAVRAPVAAVPRSYQPKPKETLDQVIEHTLPGSPLKIELLRQAFMSQNPQAFVPGKVPKLRKGVPLTVPDHDELLRIHLGARATPVVEPDQPPRVTPSTVEERKRWVQFP
jgi:Tfp pilus assembly protein FimV